MTPAPPDWAQSLISMLVPQRTRDSVVGDLLEEYRETQVLEHGKAAADFWYARQAAMFLWSASRGAGLVLAGNLAARTLLDAVMTAPVNNLAARAWITTLITMGIFLWFGFRLGRTTGRVAGALVMALAASVIGTLLAYAQGAIVLAVATAAAHPSPEAWAGLREGLDIPVHVIAVVGAVMASAGAAIGRMFTGSPTASARLL